MPGPPQCRSALELVRQPPPRDCMQIDARDSNSIAPSINLDEFMSTNNKRGITREKSKNSRDASSP